MTLRRITPRQAQEMEGMKNWRYAWLTRSIGGEFAKFRKGAKVRVKCMRGSSYQIERDKWRGSMVPLCNRLCGVPRSALRFQVAAKPK